MAKGRGAHIKLAALLSALVLVLSLTGCATEASPPASIQQSPSVQETSAADASGLSIQAYTGEPFLEINGGIPGFTAEELTLTSRESYGPLDELGRTTQAIALVSDETRPGSQEKRTSLRDVHPSGWCQKQYDCVSGGSLYNRSHLIAWSLSGKNDDPRNLITGTTYMNQTVMQPYEERILAHIRNTGKHVLLRVTPVYEGSNALATGVQYEAQSIEDGGEAICFNLFFWNVQPGVVIDHATGESWLEAATPVLPDTAGEYVLNTRTKKFHDPACDAVQKMKDQNKESFAGSREELLQGGYAPCGTCKP